MNYVIEGTGALVNEAGKETPLKASDFAQFNPDEKHQYRNRGDQPFKMICGVPKEFEWKWIIIISLNLINLLMYLLEFDTLLVNFDTWRRGVRSYTLRPIFQFFSMPKRRE